MTVACLSAALLLAACSQTRPPVVSGTGTQPRAKLALKRVNFSDLPGWAGDRHDRALVAFRRSCRKLVVGWRRPCSALAAEPQGDRASARRFFERYFTPHEVTNQGGTGFLTGYFEPILEGARRRGGRYQTPLHARPRDLATRKPYFSRAEILSPPLRTRLPALAWLADPVAAFTLHIQGSGRIRLAEGGTMRVGVAGTNGRKYVSIGRIMLREGLLRRDQASMQGIQAWLRAHPKRGKALMNRNPRYIFFRHNRGEGPIGTQGVPLTPRRSLAIDKRYIPLGMPVWLSSTWPDGNRAMRRLVIAQDTGSAIRGAVRGDLFMGAGPAALAVAGRMRQAARFYVLLPRGTVIGQAEIE